MAGGLLSLELPQVSSVSFAMACLRWDIMSGCRLERAFISGSGQGFEEVVEQAGAKSFIHPVTGEEHVVHLVHALDVPSAVFLLGLKAYCGVCKGGTVS